MKRLLVLIFSVTLLTANGSLIAQQEHNRAEESCVYICTGKSSKRYHSTKECKGLGNCGGRVIALTLTQAEKMGRTPCQICY